LSYATWEWIKLDNAKANLANETLLALCEFVGCCVDAGPRHSPDDRPYIERFFGTVHSRLSSRLPGYTGSQPRDLRRALSDPKAASLYVSFNELEDLIEYSMDIGACYTNTLLASSAHFIGRQLLVYISSHDLRSVRAFLPEGAEFGVLQAQGCGVSFRTTLNCDERSARPPMPGMTRRPSIRIRAKPT
jgi:putative transposase